MSRYRLLLRSVVVFALSACSDSPSGPPAPVPVASVEVSSPATSIEVGQSVQLSASAKDAQGNVLTGRSFTWRSSDQALATVDGNGLARTLAVGEVSITATSEGKSGTAQVRVIPVPAVITSIANLVVGQEAIASGTGLDRLSSLSVDGRPAIDFRVISASEVRFVVPSLRLCETDGRHVAIRATYADTAFHTRSPVGVAARIRMEVGESRILSAGTELSCIQLPAADHDYVITALNGSLREEPGTKPLASFRTRTVNTAPPLSASTIDRSSSAYIQDDHLTALARSGASSVTSASTQHVYSTNPPQFDRYATASVGDTLRFIQSPAGIVTFQEPFCIGPPDQVPIYLVRVIAIAGSIVIAVDLRSPKAAQVMSEASVAALSRAAGIADRWMIPAVRQIIDRAYQPLAGAGGRTYVLITDLGAPIGISGDGPNQFPQTLCPNSSEFASMRLDDDIDFARQHAPYLASMIIHEYAHVADYITGTRIDPLFRGGWYLWGLEAVAMQVEEVAARLARNMEFNASATPHAPDAPMHYWLFSTLWGVQPEWSHWGPQWTYGNVGSLLLYIREKAGLAAFSGTGATVFERLFPAGQRLRPFPGAEAIFAAFGLDASQTLDVYTLAHATNGLISAEAADAARLPRYKTWNTTYMRNPSRPNHRVSRLQDATVNLAAGNGNYAAAYLFAEEGRGISLEFTSGPSNNAVVRITRLR